MKRKVVSMLLALSMTVSCLAGCGQGAQESSTESSSAREPEDRQSSEESTEESGAEAESETPAQAGGEEGTPRISEEVITFTVAGADTVPGADWNNTVQFAEYEKRLGIKLDATVYNTEQWSSKLTLMLASDEMPDILAMDWVPMSRSDVVKYAADGYFLDFSPYLDLMPNLKKYMEEYPEYAQTITMDDGGIYGFAGLNSRPNCARYTFVYMPQKWLDNVNLDRPESLDDLYTVLKAFKEQDANGNGDPNDEIPMGLVGSSSPELLILWAYGINGLNSAYNLRDENGTVSLWDTSENYKEFLRYMNRLYKEELINQDAYVIEGSELESLTKEGKVGFSGGWTTRCADAYIDNEPGWYIPVGFTSEYNPNRSVVLYSAVDPTFYFVANADTEHPEEMAKFVDYQFTTEGAISGGNGYEGLTFDMKEIKGVGTIDHTGYWEDKYETQEDYRTRIATNHSGLSILTTGKGTIYDLLTSVSDEDLFDPEVWAVTTSSALREEAMRTEGLVVMDPFPNLYYTDEEAKERATLYTDIINYLATTKSKFITGEMDVDASWDAYLEKLNQMELPRLLEIEQAAYDRLK